MRKLGEVHPTSSGNGQTLRIRNPPIVPHSDEPVRKVIVMVLLVMVIMVLVVMMIVILVAMIIVILFWKCNV